MSDCCTECRKFIAELCRIVFVGFSEQLIIGTVNGGFTDNCQGIFILFWAQNKQGKENQNREFFIEDLWNIDWFLVKSGYSLIDFIIDFQ